MLKLHILKKNRIFRVCCIIFVSFLLLPSAVFVTLWVKITFKKRHKGHQGFIWNISFYFVLCVCLYVHIYACFVSLMNGIEFKTFCLEQYGPIIISSNLSKGLRPNSNISTNVLTYHPLWFEKWNATGFEQLEGSFEGGTSPVIQSKTWHSLTEPRPRCATFYCHHAESVWWWYGESSEESPKFTEEFDYLYPLSAQWVMEPLTICHLFHLHHQHLPACLLLTIFITLSHFFRALIESKKCC